MLSSLEPPEFTLDVKSTISELRTMLEAHGFVFKAKKDTDGLGWTGTCTKRAVIVDIEGELPRSSGYGRSGFYFRIRARDSRGRYLETERPQWIGTPCYGMDLSKPSTLKSELKRLVTSVLATKGAEVTAPPITKIGDLEWYKPLTFDKPTVVMEGNKVVARHMYEQVFVKGVAIIQHDLKVSCDAVMAPHAETWFWIQGVAATKHSGAQPEIVVSRRGDKLVYYPVRNGKITNDLRPLNTYIDFTIFSALDEEMILLAIGSWIKQAGLG